MASHPVHRFYENKFPKANEVVVVEVTKIDTMGVICKLIEYGNIEGYIPTPELSLVRIRRITHATKIGKQEVVLVLRVDQDKGSFSLQ